MGSYLKIHGRETNSKTMSSILISAIRHIDSRIKSDVMSSKEERRYFVPDEYLPNEEHYGTGDWVIHRKGIALLLQYLISASRDTDYIDELVLTQHKYALIRATNEERNKLVEEFTNTESFVLNQTILYVAEILSEMVVNKVKHVNACWI